MYWGRRVVLERERCGESGLTQIKMPALLLATLYQKCIETPRRDMDPEFCPARISKFQLPMNLSAVATTATQLHRFWE